MNKRVYVIVGVITVFVFLLIRNAYIKNATLSKNDSTQLHITTSFYPLTFFTKQIVGDRATVYNLIPSTVEPHTYEPTAQDIVHIETSDIVIVNGIIEPWLEKIQSQVQDSKTKVIVVGNGLFSQTVFEGGKDIVDPHIWLNPQLAKQEVQKISDSIIAKDQRNKDIYIQNTKQLLAQLDELDKTYKNSLTQCKENYFVTSHAAFGYMASRYGLKQIPIAGLSPEEEPSPQQLSAIIQVVKKNNIRYIFFENLMSPKFSQTIAQETGVQTLVLDPLEGISDDNQKKGFNYFTVMNQNLHNLHIALSCKP